MTQALQRPAPWNPQPAPAPRKVQGALAASPKDDLLRLRAIARLHARALPGSVSWFDLLHEAVLRALPGTRSWLPDMPLVAFLAGVMRSPYDEQWRRRLQDSLPPLPESTSPADDPERAYAASQALADTHRLFASDSAVTSLLGGRAPEEIYRHCGLTTMKYNTARRWMRRAMLDHGLALSRP